MAIEFDDMFHVKLPVGMDIKKLVKAAYDLSAPQGMGYIHYEEGSLTDAEIDQILERREALNVVLYMDYVKGRSIKMTVFKDIQDCSLFVYKSWYDHTEDQHDELIRMIA